MASGYTKSRARSRPGPSSNNVGSTLSFNASGVQMIGHRPLRRHCQTNDKDVFKRMAKLHPELEPLRQARKSVKALSLFGSSIGADGWNRASAWPFDTVTGRSNPKTSQFILNRPHWVRHLIAPAEGRALVRADIVAAEVGIAADASGDPELIRVSNSALDPYIEFAKSAGRCRRIRSETKRTVLTLSRFVACTRSPIWLSSMELVEQNSLPILGSPCGRQIALSRVISEPMQRTGHGRRPRSSRLIVLGPSPRRSDCKWR
jgi:hypothetical protein